MTFFIDPTQFLGLIKKNQLITKTNYVLPTALENDQERRRMQQEDRRL
ncbi:hypothetical protein J2S05_002550 [Alkalicoccobacillus murimartini]|uniref:Fur-regulated basic protein FbpA n=1 Tax=Alkalicoccobacillus murimartini TaxID=171685 RepID=A0ABT9YL45_9BACI|nr:hypothetical protein [Alkalicoccobacillus murimartini]